MRENGNGHMTMDPEVLAAEFRALRNLIEDGQERRWGDAEALAEHWGNVFSPKTIQNRSAPSVPDEDRIPSSILSPGGDKLYHFKTCDEWLLARRPA